MTYAELAEYMAGMTEEQLATDVTVFVHGVGEYYSLMPDSPVMQSEVDDVLTAGHVYLVI
jgi:hypothetical protein